MYKVIHRFKDKDDSIYEIGDVYPSKDAKKPTTARIKVLSTTDNKYGKTFIKKIEGK